MLDATFAGHPEYESELPRVSDVAACSYCLAWSQFCAADLQRVPVEMPMTSPMVFPLRFYFVTEGERVGPPLVRAQPEESSSLAAVKDVVQLMPEHDCGPLLMIVDEVGAWGVRCYAFVPHQGGPRQFYLRIAHDEYKRIGACAFFSAD